VSACVALDANLDRSIEEYGFDVGVVEVRGLHVCAPLLASKARRIDVGDGPAQFETVAKQESNGREDPAVNRLAGGIVNQEIADGVA